MKNKKTIILVIIVIISITSYIIIHFLIFNSKINTITIEYAYGYNVSVAQEQGYPFDIEIIKINLNGEELEQVSNLINKISFQKVSGISEAMVDTFKITVNEDYTITFDNDGGYAFYSRNNEKFLIKIPSKLYTLVNEIINKEIEKNKLLDKKLSN